MNARSIYNKLHSFQNYIQDKNTTICAITETRLSNDGNDLRYKEIPPPGYKIPSRPQQNGKRGGGITVVYKASLNIEECSPSTQNSEIHSHGLIKLAEQGHYVLIGSLLCNVLMTWATLQKPPICSPGQSLSLPPPQNKNKWVHPVIFEPQPKIQLTQSSYKVTSFLDFQPFVKGFQSGYQYLEDLLLLGG